MNWVEKLIAVAVFLQSLEFFCLGSTIQKIWSWDLIKKDFEIFPVWFRALLGFLLNDRNFFLLIGVRLICAVVLMFFAQAWLVLILFLSTLLIAMRWRGAFNGGSDAMTLMILSAVTVAGFCKDSPIVVQACLWYMAVNLCLSYFLAGLAKIKYQGWRQGTLLPAFLESSIYQIPSGFLNALSGSPAKVLASWGILLYELSFPIALLRPELAFVYMGLGVLFHLVNFHFFGLNRFFFAWIAAYPALWSCSQFM